LSARPEGARLARQAVAAKPSHRTRFSTLVMLLMCYAIEVDVLTVLCFTHISSIPHASLRRLDSRGYPEVIDQRWCRNRLLAWIVPSHSNPEVVNLSWPVMVLCRCHTQFISTHIEPHSNAQFIAPPSKDETPASAGDDLSVPSRRRSPARQRIEPHSKTVKARQCA
jgi:hypothetical protein